MTITDATPANWTSEASADPLTVLRALIARPSVTPADNGALDVVQGVLEALGFTCTRIPSGTPGATNEDALIDNLFAIRGDDGPVFGFAGHTDVVPVGEGWTRDPFAGEIHDGHVFGRGAADMKGGIAAFISAVARLPSGFPTPGRIAFLITGDEEGPAIHGTRAILKWMAANGQTLDRCLIGEPTNALELGEEIKVGRRGSLNVSLTVHGVGGHVAHPHRADNPVHRAVRLASALIDDTLDGGSDHFQPSSLQITSIDVGNPTTNVIPSKAVIRLNIRFNDRHTGASLLRWLESKADEICGGRRDLYEIDGMVCGESFLTEPERLAHLIAEACEAQLGRRPTFTTSGGTSDARFISAVCPTAEFGLVGQTMHKPDESISLDDLETLTRIYHQILIGYFSGPL